MSKGTNLESGFLLLYDWLPAIQDLDGNGVKELLLALIERQKNGTDFPEFQNCQAYIYAKMIEPTIKRRIDGQGGGNKSKESRQGTTVGTGGGTTVASRVQQSRDKQSIAKQYIPPSPSKGTDEAEQRFSIFGSAYPKKTGKGAAEKAFSKIHPSEELLQKMLKAIEIQKQSDQWRRENGQFIPLPSTWLNQKRWEDGPTETHQQLCRGNEPNLDDLI